MALPFALRQHSSGLSSRVRSASSHGSTAGRRTSRRQRPPRWRDIHDSLEAMALHHVLTCFDGKPTILARETKMNRVTL